jgi:hypothetical protein
MEAAAGVELRQHALDLQLQARAPLTRANLEIRPVFADLELALSSLSLQA